ncbi:MAG: polysaccharide biosynthesis C-terminal domain-containing protein, partial [Sinobacterium sp.]|nr:polysaccharide biosynthesis C-terminal domain-containing protein [Sinobacterium sp.]
MMKVMHLKFVTGSISKHLLTLMFASWVALASGMLLSLADMYFLSRLNDLNVLAAVGFSGSIIMFPISIGIGFSIAISVLVSQALGRDGKRAASKIFSSLLIIAMGLSVFIMGFLLLNVDFFLDALGASGEVKALAISYLSITLYSSPFAVLLMALASGLRSLALAKASMLISLLATVINFVLDPILIEVMGFGIQGAAWATVIARL